MNQVQLTQEQIDRCEAELNDRFPGICEEDYLSWSEYRDLVGHATLLEVIQAIANGLAGDADSEPPNA